MKIPTTYKIRLSGLNHRKGDNALIRRDMKDHGRIFAMFPPIVSMTPEEVIALANALADSLED